MVVQWCLFQRLAGYCKRNKQGGRNTQSQGVGDSARDVLVNSEVAIGALSSQNTQKALELLATELHAVTQCGSERSSRSSRCCCEKGEQSCECGLHFDLEGGAIGLGREELLKMVEITWCLIAWSGRFRITGRNLRLYINFLYHFT